MSRLESTLVMSVVLVGLIVGAGFVVRNYSVPIGQTLPETDQAPVVLALGTPDVEPIDVSVVAPGTIAEPLSANGSDECPELRGVQPEGFDCALPLYAPALDLSAVRLKGRYQCADPENYQLVKGQTVQRAKKCVLKTAKADPK